MLDPRLRMPMFLTLEDSKVVIGILGKSAQFCQVVVIPPCQTSSFLDSHWIQFSCIDLLLERITSTQEHGENSKIHNCQLALSLAIASAFCRNVSPIHANCGRTSMSLTQWQHLIVLKQAVREACRVSISP